jgi:phosphatidylserine/phosphatidylglycerophosphate/cardiolipin synthase-like enzyme
MTTRRASLPSRRGSDGRPRQLKPSLRNIRVEVARTLPELRGRREVREVEALDLAAIAAARDVIYLKNQYLAARSPTEAIAARLREPRGPEVVTVLPRCAESRPEQESMDSARERMVDLLRRADVHARLGVYWPATRGGTSVYVHSKVMVVDGRLLRIGSRICTTVRWVSTVNATWPSKLWPAPRITMRCDV